MKRVRSLRSPSRSPSRVRDRARGRSLRALIGRRGSSPSTLTTWGGHGSSLADATSVSRDSPVTRARELLTRARFLDEAATVDEKAAIELASRLASLRAAGEGRRVSAPIRRAPRSASCSALRADDLETDVIVSEAEVTFKRTTAADNRRVARELRLRAVKLVREAAGLRGADRAALRSAVSLHARTAARSIGSSA